MKLSVVEGGEEEKKIIKGGKRGEEWCRPWGKEKR
jgi:hypothetical protein